MKHIVRTLLLGLVLFTFCLPLMAYPQPSQQKLLIGILPEMNIFKQKQRFKALGEYLSKKTGIPIEITILSKYGNILERFTADKMDGAFFGSFTGAFAIERLGVIPLVRTLNLDNTSTYQGYLFVRKDGGIKDVKDMKGKRMAFVEKATTAGYIFPRAYLKTNGIRDLDHFFSESFFAGSHDAAISAVLNKKADVGAAKHSIYNRSRKEDPRVDKELVILAESPHVPENGLCVRRDLDVAIQQKLKDVLLGIDKDPEGVEVLKKFGALKFIATTAQDYQPVFDLSRDAGINIRTYDYRNQ